MRHLPSLHVPPELVRDTSGAGDVFHGAYVFSYLKDPRCSWDHHFRFAQHAAAYKIQHLGNEAGLPTVDAIRAIGWRPDQLEDDDAPRPASAKIAATRRSR